MHFEAVFVTLFAVATAVALTARWLKVPYTVALVVAGLVLGSVRVLDPPHLTKDLLYAIFLPGLVFEAAFHLDFQKFWQNKLAIHSHLPRSSRPSPDTASRRSRRGIDREAHLRGLPYFVIDDSNAQYLLLSNRLLAGEVDLNPLRRYVTSLPPQPRVPLQVVFDERIELIGYDAPPEVARGDELVIRLYYRVLAPVSTNYKIFLHFDGAGARWNGDHAPVGGKFQTSYWSPGTYITDEHRIPVGRMSQAPGYYQVFTGFWPGGDGPRMTVTTGQHEADQRVRIGIIRVK